MKSFLTRVLEFIIKTLNKIRVPWSVKKFNGTDYHNVLRLIKEGDIFLTTTKGELTNIFNPSKYKHGAIYIGMHKVLESVARGVVVTDLTEFLLRKDKVILGRLPINTNSKELFDISAEVLNTPYDYRFKLGNYEIYCFELVADVLSKLEDKIIISPIKTLFGVSAYTSASFLLREDFKIIYDSDKGELC
jgi:hypothetical protein